MMFSNQIDISCEHWNLNRLLVLLKVFSEKAKESDPNRKKMSQADIIARNRQLNEARKKKLNTRSEEHTSELQSRFDLVCRLLLEKKNSTSMQKPDSKLSSTHG